MSSESTLKFKAGKIHSSARHDEYFMLQDEQKFGLFPVIIIEFTNTYGMGERFQDNS